MSGDENANVPADNKLLFEAMQKQFQHLNQQFDHIRERLDQNDHRIGQLQQGAARRERQPNQNPIFPQGDRYNASDEDFDYFHDDVSSASLRRGRNGRPERHRRHHDMLIRKEMKLIEIQVLSNLQSHHFKVKMILMCILNGKGKLI